jgi:hypothetical protein
MNLATQNAPATKKQLWALFCGTGLNTTNCTISVRQASNLIDNMKNGIDIESDLRSFGATGTVKKKEDWATLFAKADKAGKEAAGKCIPTPMVVTERSNPLDDNSKIEKSWLVPQGMCGFASIRFKGNTSFGKWAAKNNLAKKSHDGGLYIWVHDYNQSVELKSAYAYAFARVLNDAGIKAFAESRLD